MPKGWSARRIARELGLHRDTVGQELKRSKPATPAKVVTGSEVEEKPKPATPAKVATGSPGKVTD